MPIPNQLTAGDARSAGAFVVRLLRLARSRSLRFVVASLAVFLLLTAGLFHHIHFDRSGLPDLESFLRFEPPGIGEVYDDRDEVLIELAREYRRVGSYEEVPRILRLAILAAEDRDFFSHSGVEYRALPRVIRKTALHSLAGWWRGNGLRPRFPQGGSTITQQLVRS